MTPTRLLLLLLPIAAAAQGLTDSWPTYNGDYSGRRYSSLKIINDANVKNLSLEWMSRITGGIPKGATNPASVSVTGTPLMINGMLYFTSVDNIWSVDARTGRIMWHYYRQSFGDEPITTNRGVGIYNNWVFYLTRDNFLVSLDATTGAERFVVPVADPKQYYFSSAAPVVIGNHIIIGTGGDSLDIPGFLQSRDPETGAIQWTRYTVPKAGEPGIETWPDEYAAMHGGGGPWIPGTYDPDLNLYYFGTGNPNPVFAPQSRKGDNLYTCAILAVNPDTGKIVWYFQPSPHDTHDWDAVQTPVIFDGVIDGQPRKLIAQASRNGYFFVLDRTNGKYIVSVPMADWLNWSLGIDAKGQPIPDPKKDPTLGGVIVWPAAGGITNAAPPAFNPDTGLFYMDTTAASFAIFYLSDTDDHPEGYGGIAGINGAQGSSGRGGLTAFDYKTGKTIWKHEGGTGRGLLTTAGNLIFSGNGNNLAAYNATTGNIVWHAGLLAAPNPPITYMLDGQQHVLVVGADIVYSFVLN